MNFKVSLLLAVLLHMFIIFSLVIWINPHVKINPMHTYLYYISHARYKNLGKQQYNLQHSYYLQQRQLTTGRGDFTRLASKLNHTYSESAAQYDSATKKLLYIIHEKIQKKLNYPLQAQLENEQGKATITFHVSQLGKITNVAIAKSSGKMDLDNAAVSTIYAISPIMEARKILKSQHVFEIDIEFDA